MSIAKSKYFFLKPSTSNLFSVDENRSAMMVNNRKKCSYNESVLIMRVKKEKDLIASVQVVRI